MTPVILANNVSFLGANPRFPRLQPRAPLRTMMSPGTICPQITGVIEFRDRGRMGKFVSVKEAS